MAKGIYALNRNEALDEILQAQREESVPMLDNANLSGADLRAVDLSGANIYAADLSEANLSGA
ncbi:MAG: pentapeptide repeat-containing protein, partial [Ktedonobacteraceae bacterium]|nr:pentapeptide repeat-containing protein [Ktedonobacteraceae bacterium]